MGPDTPAMSREGASALDRDITIVVAIGPDQRHLRRMWESLQQHAFDLDVVMVCDGVVLEKPGSYFGERSGQTRVVAQNLQGAYAARTVGALAARTNFVTFLDTDDEYRPRDVDGGACLTYGDQKLEVDDSSSAPPALHALVQKGVDVGAHLMSMVVRRECFLRAGGFTSRLRHAADLDLKLRMEKSGHVVRHVRQPWLIRHLHDGNESHDSRGSLSELFQILRQQAAFNSDSDVTLPCTASTLGSP